MRLGSLTSGSRTISTGTSQGCVLSPQLFSIYTNECTAGNSSVQLLKYADDTAVIGSIKDGHESAYRQEVKQLERIVDFRRDPPALHPLTILNNTGPTTDT